MSACLRGKLSSDEHEQIAGAVDILKAIIVVRNKITHGGAELLDALRYLGIKYPISDYSESWDRIRSKAAEALTMIRSSLETLGQTVIAQILLLAITAGDARDRFDSPST